jgi:hypothetical protein
VRCDLEALAGTASDVGGYAGQLLGPDILVIHHGKRAWRGLMIIPVLLGARTSVCVPLTPGEYIWAGFNPALSAIVFAVHMISHLAVSGLIAWLVYDFVGLAVLRRTWINVI